MSVRLGGIRRLGHVVVVCCIAATWLFYGSTEVKAQSVAAPEPVCSVKDSRLNELSGLVSDGNQWYAINDGGSKVEVFVVNRECKVQRTISHKTDPFDVEDLARDSQGRFWLSDTGDNQKQRDTIALHVLTPQGQSTLYRLTYPDGKHDAEALVVDKAGIPYLITKNVFGDAGVYRPAKDLASPGPTQLEKVGTVPIAATGTKGGPVGSLGSTVVTGAATNSDGTVIAIRTYTDAYLYSAPDGDVVAALRGTPMTIPLPDEKQGEAVAFEPDGSLLSASEGAGESIRKVPGAVAMATANATTASASPATKTAQQFAPLILGVIAVAGLLFGIRRLRRRRT